MSFFSCYCLLHENFTEWVERQLPQDIRHSSDNNQAQVKFIKKELEIPFYSLLLSSYMKTLEIIKSHGLVESGRLFEPKGLLVLLVLVPYDYHSSIEFYDVMSFSLDKPLTKNKLLNIKCQPNSFHFEKRGYVFFFFQNKNFS